MMKILAIPILLFAPLAMANKCEDIDLEKSFANSDEVLFVKVTSTKLVDANDEENIIIEVNYDVIESFKAETNSPNYVLEGTTSADLGLLTGRKYLLYINSRRYVGGCSGSTYVPNWVDLDDEIFDVPNRLRAY